jgi:hypothetical protein
MVFRFAASDPGRLALMTFHVTLNVRTGRNHRVAYAVGVIQRALGQRRRYASTAQGIGNERPIEVQSLLTQVHVRQVGTVAVYVDFELMAGLIMMDGQRLAHRYSSRVLELDPYLTDLFPAKEHLRHPVPVLTPRRAWLISNEEHLSIVGVITEYAQAAQT